MKLPIRFDRLVACLLTFLLWSGAVNGQLDSNELQKIPGTNRRLERHPKDLVATLIAGKESDEAKFEAIFTWVATNIHYDYRQYFSGKGADAETDLQRVLRKKKAICFQYAELMNYLCSFADLHSVTVTGYAKDLLFDVGDTLYFDNHAWNAVKLDNRWYVYDVTWSAGGYVFRLTRFSERIIRWRNTIQTTKMKLLKYKIILYVKGNKLCKIPSHKEKQIRKVLGLPWFWRVIDRILSWHRPRMVIDDGVLKNKDFYLTEPRLFATTHFPNVPYWSLTEDMETINAFSADSSYYDLEPSDYTNQQREGKMCLPCDDFFALDSLGQQKEQIVQSLANNKRNGLVPAEHYFRIAALFHKEAEFAVDSLTKVQAYDSAVFYLNLAKVELKRSGPQNNAFYKFHTKKEQQKIKQQKKINARHTANNITNLSNLRPRANRIKSIPGKIKSNQNRYKRDYSSLQRLKAKSPRITMKEATYNTIVGRIEEQEFTTDSVNDRITVLEESLLLQVKELSNLVWEQSRLLYPQVLYFYQSANYRMYGSLDNRDKELVLVQDTINAYEELFALSVKTELLLPSDTLYSEFSELIKLIRLRNRNQVKLMKLYHKLYEGKQLDRDSLEGVRTRYLDMIQKDYCYFFQHQLPIKVFLTGYERFKESHYTLYKAIRADNKAELARHKVFVKEILLTKHRVSHVIQHNLKYQANYKRRIIQAKKDYLKELKEGE